MHSFVRTMTLPFTTPRLFAWQNGDGALVKATLAFDLAWRENWRVPCPGRGCSWRLLAFVTPAGG
jgi:hypothetical protein